MRLRDYTPCGHWQTHTVVAGLRVDGLISATAVFDGPIDTPTFLAYVEQSGADAASGRRRGPRQPRGAQATGGPCRDRTRRRPAPLSAALQSGLQPDRTSLCEAEGVLARRATPAASTNVPWTSSAIALELFSPTECLNFVRHCGYRVSTVINA